MNVVQVAKQDFVLAAGWRLAKTQFAAHDGGTGLELSSCFSSLAWLKAWVCNHCSLYLVFSVPLNITIYNTLNINYIY